METLPEPPKKSDEKDGDYWHGVAEKYCALAATRGETIKKLQRLITEKDTANADLRRRCGLS